MSYHQIQAWPCPEIFLSRRRSVPVIPDSARGSYSLSAFTFPAPFSGGATDATPAIGFSLTDFSFPAPFSGGATDGTPAIGFALTAFAFPVPFVNSPVVNDSGTANGFSLVSFAYPLPQTFTFGETLATNSGFALTGFVLP